MTIKVWDYLVEHELERESIEKAVDRVFRSGRLILGENVTRFEQAFSAFCGVKHGVGVNSGTDALFLSLRALGVGPGDEVITVPNTAVPTVSAIVTAGATPRFVDIDPDTFLMDVAELPRALSPRVKCVLPVHLYGQCVDMDALTEVTRPRGISVLEDCAQSHGALYQGRRAGGLGDVAAFSFYPTKILGGYGDGGMAISDDPAVDGALRRLRFYGMEKTYYANEHGYNSRLDELHAAILLEKLAHLESYVERRRALARRYDEALADTGLVLPREAPGNRHAYYLYVCRHSQRDLILEELRKADILLNVSYPWPIHTMTGYGYLGYRNGDFPHAEAACREVFSLPMYPTLSEADQDRTIEVMTGLLRRLS
ncbi:MAG: DegT/DnrJ/EryC1/StrS family aminotransferase [Polyangiaceae bacterium]|nr:DegT/DnrJ/EryC1/StrS family aminotransferase [Polyangiaceae bacterium]